VIVVDASVLANALTDDGPAGIRARGELTNDPHWVAPEHLVVAVFSAVRGLWLRDRISERRAVEALAAVTEARIDLADTSTLLPRMWELRDSLTGYDAAYVAVAEAYGCPLVTADLRLAHASGIRCDVMVAVEPQPEHP
jgi:predicted nucleic acid-binding protein